MDYTRLIPAFIYVAVNLPVLNGTELYCPTRSTERQSLYHII